MAQIGAKIVIADPLSAAGLDLLRSAGAEVVELGDGGRDQLVALVAEADALLVRSRTKVDAALLRAGKKLRVVGRAGIGVDNVDVPTATELGILVVNAPTANLLSAAEHTFALLLALARNVSAADASMKAGEWTRSRFEGVELKDKTLGIIGLGRIGQQVAARARAFEMKVIAFDPYLTPEQGERLGVELANLETLLAQSDAVTLHVPFSEETRGLLDAERLAGMKRGALLVNCSRGGVVDEGALLAALDAGHLGGAALDVFFQEPPGDLSLAGHPRVVATPHLGAQTAEAQERTSTETAQMVLAALSGSLTVTAVNLPFRSAGSRGEPYLRLAEQLGHLAAAMLDGPPESVRVGLCGLDEGLHTPVAVAVLKGALSHTHAGLNYVNVERAAQAKGVAIARALHPAPPGYPHLVVVTVSNEKGEMELAGAVFREREPRVVRFGSQPLEFWPEGTLLVLRSWDRPGVVGNVCTLLGDAGVNIADIHLARKDGEPDAWTILRLDERPSDEVIGRLGALPNVQRVMVAEL
jgi:D-3-phosphoglycerate dehydrogenase